eukprot:TRINITY_DN4675_c0_g1_i1.p1 TRINITY_DN4675_c0_g1~~TRINITY_DN4675_c0_g1_i1.p1  ORF type:complete len:551 (-),score=141.61 TRINITY_DN4675_c0_g1_i1:1081-2733(-)
MKRRGAAAEEVKQRKYQVLMNRGRAGAGMRALRRAGAIARGGSLYDMTYAAAAVPEPPPASLNAVAAQSTGARGRGRRRQPVETKVVTQGGVTRTYAKRPAGGFGGSAPKRVKTARSKQPRQPKQRQKATGGLNLPRVGPEDMCFNLPGPSHRIIENSHAFKDVAAFYRTTAHCHFEDADVCVELNGFYKSDLAAAARHIVLCCLRPYTLCLAPARRFALRRCFAAGRPAAVIAPPVAAADAPADPAWQASALDSCVRHAITLCHEVPLAGEESVVLRCRLGKLTFAAADDLDGVEVSLDGEADPRLRARDCSAAVDRAACAAYLDTFASQPGVGVRRKEVYAVILQHGKWAPAIELRLAAAADSSGAVELTRVLFDQRALVVDLPAPSLSPAECDVRLTVTRRARQQLPPEVARDVGALVSDSRIENGALLIPLSDNYRVSLIRQRSERKVALPGGAVLVEKHVQQQLADGTFREEHELHLYDSTWRAQLRQGAAPDIARFLREVARPAAAAVLPDFPAPADIAVGATVAPQASAADAAGFSFAFPTAT